MSGVKNAKGVIPRIIAQIRGCKQVPQHRLKRDLRKKPAIEVAATRGFLNPARQALTTW
jgi:hypothetical protein